MLMPDEVLQIATGFGEPDGPAVELRITGLVRVPGPAIEPPPILASPAFATRYAEPMSTGRELPPPAQRRRLHPKPSRRPSIAWSATFLRPTRSFPLELLRPDDAASTTEARPTALSRGRLVVAAVAGAAGLLTAALALLRYQASSADRGALVRARPGTDRGALRRELAETYEITAPDPPAEVSNPGALGRLRPRWAPASPSSPPPPSATCSW
ncbi:MAG: hypothetical protein ACRD0N_06945 [Acidimicrobiales bacterium]